MQYAIVGGWVLSVLFTLQLYCGTCVCEGEESVTSTNSPRTNHTTQRTLQEGIKHANLNIPFSDGIKKVMNITKNQNLTDNQVTKSKKKLNLEQQKHNMIRDPQFEYIIGNKDMCDPDTNIFIWVHTAPNQPRKRLTLRETWANPQSFPSGYKAKLGFFIGAVEHKNPNMSSLIQHRLEFENELYHDIIQENYVDHYHNMSYKAISAVKWITNYCPQAKLVIKTDDDTLVDMPLIIHHIHHLQSQHQMLNNSVLCRVYDNAVVLRRGKWKILKSEYEGKRFPPYCQGLAMVMTGDVVSKLYTESRRLTPLWIDDAWMFGVVLQQTNASFLRVSTKQDNKGVKKQEMLQPNELHLQNYVPFYHLHKIDLIHYMWRKMKMIWNAFQRNSKLLTGGVT